MGATWSASDAGVRGEAGDSRRRVNPGRWTVRARRRSARPAQCVCRAPAARVDRTAVGRSSWRTARNACCVTKTNQERAVRGSARRGKAPTPCGYARGRGALCASRDARSDRRDAELGGMPPSQRPTVVLDARECGHAEDRGGLRREPAAERRWHAAGGDPPSAPQVPDGRAGWRDDGGRYPSSVMNRCLPPDATLPALTPMTPRHLRRRPVRLVLAALCCIVALPLTAQPPNAPAPGSREAMWWAPTAEDWKKPVLIQWQRTWEDAVALSKETGRPILV